VSKRVVFQQCKTGKTGLFMAFELTSKGNWGQKWRLVPN